MKIRLHVLMPIRPRLYEASGSAGKRCVLPYVWIPLKNSSQVFYVGTNSHDDLTEIRRFLLKDLPRLPIAGNTSTAWLMILGRSTVKTPSCSLKNSVQPKYLLHLQ